MKMNSSVIDKFSRLFCFFKYLFINKTRKKLNVFLSLSVQRKQQQQKTHNLSRQAKQLFLFNCDNPIYSPATQINTRMNNPDYYFEFIINTNL